MTAPADTGLREVAGLLGALERGGPDALWPEALAFVRSRVPCDACALLRRDGEVLVPLAIHGLSPDVMGRRFRLGDHPRLEAIMKGGEGRGPVLRFAADCGLPDPYDGLIPDHEDRLHIHDCVGARLGEGWGALTFDALDPNALAGALDGIAEVAAVLAPLIALAERQAALTERLSRAGELHRVLAEVPASGGEIVGRSPAVTAMLREIDAVADSDLAVLLTGETGTGKELAALRLHRRSARAGAALIQVNCAALPETLIESELFGHVRGAFTGATAERSGRFELADGGTLLLDEVGELPLSAQSKLLRTLQNGEIQRVGSDRHIKVDVRLIAATNRDLAEEVRAGRFRADLYHRLSVYPLRVPPLRDRGRDVLLLAGHFLERERARLRLRNVRLSPEAQRRLLAYGWPGNVRELEHVISRAAVRAMAQGAAHQGVLTLGPEAVGLGETPPGMAPPAEACSAGPEEGGAPPQEGATMRDAVDILQRRLIIERLRENGGNWSAAARSLGLDRSNLLRLARRLSIRDDEG
nr:nitric oxide reductase transcriptional regulator NorR [Azospirillum sp. SYSU D00513]